MPHIASWVGVGPARHCPGPTCIFKEEVDVVGGGKARSANSSSGSKTYSGRGEWGQLHTCPGLWAPCCQVPSYPRASPRPLALPTMLRTLCVWLCSGSGRVGMCTHSGTVTVPPSRSATITSSCGPKAARGQAPAGRLQGLGKRGRSGTTLTRSCVSAWKAALTPMMKGVGVLRTSRSCAGRMGT